MDVKLGAIREQDKSSITSAEIKFMRRKLKIHVAEITKRTNIFYRKLKLTHL
jgi:hypothetical protein